MNQSYKVTIKSLSPLFMNKIAMDIKNNSTPYEQALLTTYTDSKGKFYIPGPDIFNAIIAAGKFYKLTTSKKSLIPESMRFLDKKCILNTQDFKVDSRIVKLPTGWRRLEYLARFDE